MFIIIEITDEKREAQGSQDTWDRHHKWFKIRDHFYEFSILEIWLETLGDSEVKSETAHLPYMEGKKKLKKEAGHSRLLGGGLNQQGNL